MNQSLAGDLAAVMPLAVATGLFVSLATVTMAPDTQGPTGNFTAAYVPVTDLVDTLGRAVPEDGIPCMDAPPSISRVQATEVKAVAEILSVGLRHVLLDRCFADAAFWSGRGYRVTVDGTVYDLMGAENDSQERMTRLDLKLVVL